MRKSLLCLVALGLVVLGATPALAHVTVDPSSAASGASDVTLRFRVPNEEDNSTTSKVELFLPTDHPIAGVAVEAAPGWTVTTETTKLAKAIHTDDGDITDVVSKVTWDGGSIGAGQFAEFTIEAGALPDDTSSLVFKAVQTYANGDVVRWIDVPTSSGAEPEHPAPTLKLTTTPASSTKSNANKKRADIALGLGLVAVIISAVATGIAVSGRRG
ncbi:MAG TPA: YcnI family protein [Acidimicrobiales bacterium]|nr:YcnI family protein [Acidimicrobiales bacterium]